MVVSWGSIRCYFSVGRGGISSWGSVCSWSGVCSRCGISHFGDGWGGVCKWGSYFCVGRSGISCRSGVSHGSCYFSYSWCSIGNWGGGDSFDCYCSGFLVHNSVESVVRIGGVFYCTLGTIGIDEGVATLDYISATRFNLAFGVTGVGVADGVSVIVMSGCCRFSDDGFGNWCSICYWSSYFGVGGGGVSRSGISDRSWGSGIFVCGSGVADSCRGCVRNCCRSGCVFGDGSGRGIAV